MGKATALILVIIILLTAFILLTNKEVKEQVFKAIPFLNKEGEETSEQLSESESTAVSGEENTAKTTPIA